MSQAFRTKAGGLIDRGRLIHFEFDGRRMSGFAGDTLASALLANGVHLVGRSFKYHRPRGVLAAGSDEANALVTVQRDPARRTPNLRATEVELYEGLRAESQNRWPSLRFDLRAINDWLAPLLPSGFYYKTFMWPRTAWRKLYEPCIRAAAGLGRAPAHSDPDRYSSRFAHCDVLIIGAGPAGLSAADVAAKAGVRVILCDEQQKLGGALLRDPDLNDLNHPTTIWREKILRALRDNPRVTILARTTAFGYFPHNLVALNERLTDHLASAPRHLPRERLWQVRAKEVVIATGALERPLVFPANDRPGCMLAGAARAYLNQYGVLTGTRAVLVTACDEAYRAALDLHAAGVAIMLIADVRGEAAGPLSAVARSLGIQVRTRIKILGTKGRLRVSAIRFTQMDEHGRQSGSLQTLPCDLILMSGGYTPTVHLFSQSRGKLAWHESLQSFIPAEAIERVRTVGACRGVFSSEAAFADGVRGGAAAAQDSLGVGALPASAAPSADLAQGQSGTLPRHQEPSRRAFVDWQNDVTSEDLVLATREGFRSIEHIKRYTTTGMATDQGKTSNLNALGIAAGELDQPIPAVGLTTFRTPYSPITFGSFAGIARGALFDPIRTTPIHDWAAQRGAVFEDVGLWKRARHFPRPNEDMHAAVARECLAVRRSCGLFDASTLGKIEVVGPDAVTFLERMYVNTWSTLAVGRARYGLLLRDDGFIFDDGVVARTAPDRFHVTTTTAGAARVLALMEDYLQTEWPDLKVWLTSTTDQWAVIAIQGPNSRNVLRSLIEDADISAQALPHMGVTHGRICGAPMLLCRVSFTGEMGFEVNVPADFGASVWEAIYEAGRGQGITAYGTEAMHVLRAEKGYIIVGQDSDGTVTPEDAGLSWMIGRKKQDFVGKRSLERPAMLSQDRKQLVGLLTQTPEVVLEEGTQVMQAEAPRGQRPIGHVTSAYFSPTLGRSIALALVSGGRARSGQALQVPMPQGPVSVTACSPVFYDPDGARLHG